MSTAMDRRVDLLRFRQPYFQGKVDRTRALIAKALSAMQRPYVAFSGGKDSLVCLALVLEQRPTITVIWSDDELEHQETVEYIRRLAVEWPFELVICAGWAEHAGWFRPWRDRPFWRDQLPGTVHVGEMLQTWGPRQGYDGTFLGLRRAENARRKTYLGARGALHRCRDGTWRCNPLSGWTGDEVWAAIAGLGLPYNPVYDRLAQIGVPRDRQRIGPLPLAEGWHLRLGWPDLYRRLIARYGQRW